jgi:hypothetical protein
MNNLIFSILLFCIFFVSCNFKNNNNNKDDIFACDNENKQNTVVPNNENNYDNKGKTFVYKDKVEITLPDKFYIESSIIYNDKEEKIGEFSPGLITPLKKISFSEILELYKYGGEIQAKEITLYFGDEESSNETDGLLNVKRIDSVQLTNYKWYFIVDETMYESGYEDDWGYWNNYGFITFEKDKILFITFYDKDIKKDKIDYFINIIKTVKIR